MVSESAVPWTAAHKASLSLTVSWNLLKLMSIKSVMSSNHLILCDPAIPFSFPQYFLALGSFPMSRLFGGGGQIVRSSASASVLPMNIQDWFPLGLTGLISLLYKELSRVFPTPQFKSINSSVLRLLYGPILTSTLDYRGNHSFDFMDLCQQSYVTLFNTLSRFVIDLLLRSVFKFRGCSYHPQWFWSLRK